MDDAGETAGILLGVARQGGADRAQVGLAANAMIRLARLMDERDENAQEQQQDQNQHHQLHHREAAAEASRVRKRHVAILSKRWTVVTGASISPLAA